MYRRKLMPRFLNVLLSEPGEKEQIISALKISDPASLVCQGCGRSGCMKLHGTYKRGITYEENGQIIDAFVMIPVFFCAFCDYHHAFLTAYLVPFCSYTLSFILKVLKAYFERSCTIPEFCLKWQISRPTLYSWKKRFRQHSALFMQHHGLPFSSSSASDPSALTDDPDASDEPCTPCHAPSETPGYNSLDHNHSLLPCRSLYDALMLILLTPDLPFTFFTFFDFSFLQRCTRKHLKSLPRPG